MIIVLKNADFSKSNIGTLSTWRITRSLGAGATYSGPTSVDKGMAFSATVTLAEGYEVGADGVVVTMGGVGQAYTINDNVITINIASVTGNILIKVPTNSIVVNPDIPDEPDIPVYYTITYKYMDSNGTIIKTSTTETVESGTRKNFSISNAATINGYTVSSVSPTSAIVTSNISVTYIYNAEKIDEPIEYPINVTNWEQGSYNQGSLSTDTNRIRAGYFNLEPNAQINMQLKGEWRGYVCYKSALNSHKLIGTQSWTNNEIFTVDEDSCNNILIVLKNGNAATVLPSDFTEENAGTVVITAPVEIIVDTIATYTNSDFEIGGLSTARAELNTTETNRIRTGMLECQSGDIVEFTIPDNMSGYVAYMEAGATSMQNTNWLKGSQKVVLSVDGYFVIVLRNEPDAVFTDTSAFTSTVELKRQRIGG